MATVEHAIAKPMGEKVKFGLGTVILVLLIILGLGVAIVRYAKGLGIISNMNDGYPWGIWIGFDLLCGVALAAGGFVIAGAVYIFKLEKYHPVVRPAILTSFLGYILVIMALLVDLGQYFKIWHPLVFWQHDSVLFEVGWCVTLYATVLFLEFLPMVFERFQWRRLERLFRTLVPIAIIVMLTLFTAAMTYSFIWAFIVFVIVTFFQILVWTGVFPREPKVPALLIMAGVIFSTLHQSSLGSLFLAFPHKLSVLWHTPILPLLFFTSAVAVGLAMIIFESTISSRVFKRGLEIEILSGLGRAIPYVLAIYLTLKIGDLIGRGAIYSMFALNVQALLFWGEIMIGIILPIVLLITPEAYNNAKGLFWAAFCVIFGVVVNRLSVGIIGIKVMKWERYFPAWSEFAITIAIISAGLLAFLLAVKYLPVFHEEQAES